MRCTRTLALALALTVPTIARAAPPATTPAAPIRVVVWDEQQPEQKKAYGDKFLGETIADALSKNPRLAVTAAAMRPKGETDLDPALSDNALDRTDVLIWWGHVRNREIRQRTGDRIAERVKTGRLALVCLHSAHWSSPFIAAMNARAIDDAIKSVPEADRPKVTTSLIYPKLAVPKPDAPLTPSFTRKKNPDGTSLLVINLPNCVFPSYRADGKPSHVTTLQPNHPIAKGLPATWDVPQTEMYNEPFHVPKPDAVIFEETWDAGERFRSGALWAVGKGNVFYFRPGHETYPVYKEKWPLKVVENAALWLGEQVQAQRAAQAVPIDR
jgi:trehalose utilization protein